HIRVSIRGRKLKRWQRHHNTTHAKIRCSTNRITDLIRAVLTLHLARSTPR
ncbi:IS5/IS1182 family transposase, partial [Streptomyces roseolus]